MINPCHIFCRFVSGISRHSLNVHELPVHIAHTSSIKNVTWSHGNSRSFLVTNQLGGSLVEIHTKFHDYSMSFIQVLSVFVFHAQTLYGLWTSSSHGMSMAFAKEMMGFPPDLVSFSNQTKLPSKLHEKI